MSHHLDSPLAREDIRLDISDAGQDVAGFHPEALYEFKIDGNGDAVEELTYRFSFGARNGAGHQNVRLRKATGSEATDPHSPGVVVAEGRTDATVEGEDGLRLWAGKAGDPFWIEPDVLRAVGEAFQHGTRIDLDAWDSRQAKNLFAGHSVYSIVIEVPNAVLLAVAGHEQRIGLWGLTTLATDAGGWRPINRAGLPMIHPLFTQLNEGLGNRLNGGRPSEDPQTYGKLLVDLVAAMVTANGTTEDPGAYAELVVSRFLPNVPRYTLGTPAAFSFAGWNGRALTDNAPDVMFSLASNSAVTLGLGTESVTSKPSR